MRPVRALTAAAVLLALLLAMQPAAGARPSPASRGDAGLAIGTVHTQWSADTWNDATSVASARSVLRDSTLTEAQAMMGWGAMNPEPSPGRYDFASLDERVTLMERTSSQPTIVLCCAPDWMKGGASGTTDWSTLEDAPLDAHVRDFAGLAVAVAKRYPRVRRYVVWNELKGFYDAQRNTWDMERYDRLYNAVYDALKAYDPALAVGGPYVPMDSWSNARTMSNPSDVAGPWGVVDQRSLDAVATWLKQAHGADFIAVDGGTATRDAGLATDPLTATGKFSAVTLWIRAHSALPVWWVEFYAPAEPGASAARTAGLQGAALLQMASAGVAAAFTWQPQADGQRCSGCLWSDTRRTGGGRPTASARLLAVLRPVLGGLPAGRTKLTVHGESIALTGQWGSVVLDARRGTASVSWR